MILEHVMIVVIQMITNELMIMHRYDYYREIYNCYQAYCMFGFLLWVHLVDSGSPSYLLGICHMRQ